MGDVEMHAETLVISWQIVIEAIDGRCFDDGNQHGAGEDGHIPATDACREAFVSDQHIRCSAQSDAQL